MVHIILLILKILGCIILGILALLLAALLVALFVPFRYELSAVYDGKSEISCKISWLFGAVKVRGGLKNKRMYARANVLWFRIFGMGEDEKQAAKDFAEATDAARDVLETELSDILEEPPEEAEPVKLSELPESPITEVPLTEVSPLPETDMKSVMKKKALTAKKEKKRERTETKKKKRKRGLSERLSDFYEDLIHKKELLERFWNADFTQGTIRFVKKALISIICHLRPKKISGNIHFGFGRPSDTGRILGYASTLYAWYGDSLKLYPDFEETVFDGDMDIRGSVQIYIFLYWGLRGLLNKDLRRLLRYIKHFKGKEETLWQ